MKLDLFGLCINILLSLTAMLGTATSAEENEAYLNGQALATIRSLFCQKETATANVNEIVEDKQGMNVLYAYYGLSCANGVIREDVQNRTTYWAKGLCDGKDSCSGTVHTSVLTDPYGGCAKDFLVVAKCASGETISDLVTPEAQGQQFSLQCPLCSCQRR